ncbi:hypothetical protein AB4Z52_32815 [Rhizobium sp. 2YAF20]|uniref:hypothetical protein n=1 Tax=Rhizobium sp. 2YAF20 TaxID=3233027 RepID=UPI003F95D6D9
MGRLKSKLCGRRACVSGRADLANAVDEEYGLQAHVLGTSTNNTPDALLLGVLDDAAAGRIAADQIGTQYKQALATDQKVTAGAALAILAIAGATIAPEVYTACLTNPIACNELLIAAGEMSAGDALGGATLAVRVSMVAGALVVSKGDQIVGVVDKTSGKILQITDDELRTLVAEEIKSAAPQSSVWSLNTLVRGSTIETRLAETEYSSASGWFHIGAENNGYFPLIDFQSGNTVVSLKSVDTTGSTWLVRMQNTIDELRDSRITIDGTTANKILDIRVQPGGATSAQSLVEYGKSQGITVLIKEFQ